jgi:hypothetical protein
MSRQATEAAPSQIEAAPAPEAKTA